MDFSAFTVPGVFGFFWLVFSKMEKLQSARNKEFLKKWIKGEIHADVKEWNNIYLRFFATIFGAKHFGFRCFRRSMYLTLVILLSLVGLWFAHNVKNPMDYLTEGDRDLYVNGWIIIVSVIFGAIVCDFFTLYKTRILLTKFHLLADAMGGILLIIIDGLATILILLLAAYLGSLAIDFALNNGLIQEPAELRQLYGAEKLPDPTVREFLQEIWFISYPFPFYLLLISALCTSAWLWLYFIIALILKMIMAVPVSARWLNWVIDVDSHPARALGLISGGVCAAVYALIVGVTKLV